MVRGWLIGAAALLMACAGSLPTRAAPPEPWTLDSLVQSAHQRGAPFEMALSDPMFTRASAPPTPWQAGFTLPTNPDRILRPLAALAQMRAKNALVARSLEALWATRTRIRDALVDYCEARELSRLQPELKDESAVRLFALGGLAFVPLAELQNGVVLCTDFAALPSPPDDATLLRDALTHRTDYLRALENYLFQKSLWHKRRGAPQRPSGATLPIAFSVVGGDGPAPATLDVALRHRLLVREVRDYAADYRSAYQEATTAAASEHAQVRVSAWFSAQRALTPLEDATRSIIHAEASLARPW